MGGLSRKRTLPRIVKKTRKGNQKGKGTARDIAPQFRDKWDPKKTLKQKYEDLGLTLDLKPNLRHSAAGAALRESA